MSGVYQVASYEDIRMCRQIWGVSEAQAIWYYDYVQKNTHFGQGLYFPYISHDEGAGVMLCISTPSSASSGKRNGSDSVSKTDDCMSQHTCLLTPCQLFNSPWETYLV